MRRGRLVNGAGRKAGKDRSGAQAAARTVLAGAAAAAPRSRSASKRREQRLAGIIASVMDAIIALDERHEITLVNPAAGQMFGYTEAELLGKSISVLIPERYRDAHDAHILCFARTGTSNRGMGRFGQIVARRADGGEFPVDASIAQSEWDGERLFIVVLREVTQRVEAENALRRNYELLDRIFATTHFCIVYLDRAFNFVRVNQAYANACGYAPEYFVGKNHFDLYPGEKIEAIFRNAVATGQPFTAYANPFEFPDHPEWGVTYWDWTLHPLKNEDGRVEGLLFALLDVTQRKRAAEELHANERSLRLALKSVDMAVFHQDRDLRYTWMYSPQLGYMPDNVLGRTDPELLSPDDLPPIVDLKRGVLENGVGARAEVSVTRLNKKHYFDLVVEPLVDAAGNIVGVTGASTDITERKRAERERAQLAAIVESSNDAVLLRGLDGTILSWNAAAERLFGWSEQEALGQPIDLIVPPERTGTLRRFVEGAARGETFSPVESIHLRKDGARIPTQVTFSPIADPRGTVIGHSYTVRDMTELKRKEEVLRGYASRLRKLSYRLRTVEEKERHAISRELHDRIGQELSTFGLILGSLGAKLPRESLRTVEKQLHDMQGLLKSMVANVRDVMAELRPPVLDDYGLLAALRQLASEFAQRSGIAAELSGVDLQSRLPPIVETAMFRISQEALNNIAKHAQAKHVEIGLYEVSGRVTLDIADDGVGFDSNETPPDKQHWGLITMRERAEAVGIDFRLESAPGAGTRIVLEAERAAA
jgi:PAS domain S-box-containing protein